MNGSNLVRIKCESSVILTINLFIRDSTQSAQLEGKLIILTIRHILQHLMITSIDNMIIQPLIHAMTNMHTHKIYNMHIYVCIELDIEICGSALLKVKQKKQIPLCLWAQFVRIGLGVPGAMR